MEFILTFLFFLWSCNIQLNTLPRTHILTHSCSWHSQFFKLTNLFFNSLSQYKFLYSEQKGVKYRQSYIQETQLQETMYLLLQNQYSARKYICFMYSYSMKFIGISYLNWPPKEKLFPQVTDFLTLSFHQRSCH